MKSSQVTPVQVFGKRLAQLRREKAYREERDLWPIDVAKAVEAGQSSVSRWENGEVFPNDDAMGRLAAFYGVTRAWLRYGEGERYATAPIMKETESETDITAAHQPATSKRAAGSGRGHHSK